MVRFGRGATGNDGQLGDGTWFEYHSPVQIGSATNWETVAAGSYHAIAIKTDGTLWDSYGAYSQIGSATNWLVGFIRTLS